MKYVPLSELSDEHWYEAYLTVYDRKLAQYMGTDPRFVVNPPSLVDFYNNITAHMQNGTFMGWAIVDDDENYLGHAILDKSTGEWELGVVVPDESRRGTGIGIRAAIYAMNWAFENPECEWVIAYANHPSTDFMRKFLIRAGFRKMMNFYVIDRPTFEERWKYKEDRTD